MQRSCTNNDDQGEKQSPGFTSQNVVDKTPGCQVFLGGSCNPTTWRRDIAVPYLKAEGITYFNPQVADWNPTLIELEHHAKENADVLFFVIDSQTRAVVVMVEVAFLIAKKRKVVLAISGVKGPGSLISNEPISQIEYEDLSFAQLTLQYLAERHGVPVFNDIETALTYTKEVLRGNLSPQVSPLLPQLDHSPHSPVQSTHLQNFNSKTETFRHLREVFVSLDRDREGNLVDLGGVRDVFLGGSSSDDNWRSEKVIPQLEEHKLTYYIPEVDALSRRFSHIDGRTAENCKVLFFNIPSSSRSVENMLTASYYFGLGYKVVLYIDHLKQDCKIDDEKLSSVAIKDYNRGRSYLEDIAKRERATVFVDINKAIECILEKCRSHSVSQ